MKKYIGKRLLQLIPILFGITLLCFCLMRLSSGDAVDVMENNTGIALSDEAKAKIRAELGLDKPFIVQYGTWLKNTLSGDMGRSYVSGKPVFASFMQKLPATIELSASSIVCTVLISVPLGILAAVKQNQLIDYLIRFCSFIGNSLPGFFTSLLLIYFFSLKLSLFPVIQSAGENTLTNIVLPTATLTIAMSAKYIRQLRAAVLEELNKDYVMGARARGVRENVILFCSVLKISLFTIITLLSLSVGSLLGGTAVVESIFMWDGVGKMAVDAAAMRDYPVILAYVVWMAFIYAVVNLITDIVYRFLDPRVRLGAQERS